MGWRTVSSLLIAAALFTAPRSARADDPNVRPLRYDLPLDEGISMGATALIVTIEAFKGRLTPLRCRICSREPDGRDTLNGFDATAHQALTVPWREFPQTLSNIVAFELGPPAVSGVLIGAAGKDRAGARVPVDLLLTYEATAISLTLDEIVKVVAARERPDRHFARNLLKAYDTVDSRLSFYSGHTTLAFALATSTGTIASLHHYRAAPVVWSTGLSFAVLTGYMRIAAERHYASDVLVGALLGAVIGVGVPFVFHRPTSSAAADGSLSSATGAADVSARTFTFGAHF